MPTTRTGNTTKRVRMKYKTIVVVIISVVFSFTACSNRSVEEEALKHTENEQQNEQQNVREEIQQTKGFTGKIVLIVILSCISIGSELFHYIKYKKYAKTVYQSAELFIFISEIISTSFLLKVYRSSYLPPERDAIVSVIKQRQGWCKLALFYIGMLGLSCHHAIRRKYAKVISDFTRVSAYLLMMTRF
jgi:hypothetical protein